MFYLKISRVLSMLFFLACGAMPTGTSAEDAASTTDTGVMKKAVEKTIVSENASTENARNNDTPPAAKKEKFQPAKSSVKQKKLSKKKLNLWRLKAIRQKKSVDFIDMPLADALQGFANDLKINLVFEPTVDREQLVNLSLKDMEWRHAFRWVLRQHNLKCVLTDDVLFIVPENWRNKTRKLQTYNMGDLVREIYDHPAPKRVRKIGKLADDEDDD